eukprot:4001128-Ditylum_brightwellii.AAC.1
MMGMIALQLPQHQESYDQAVGSNRSADGWAADLIFGILLIICSCWLNRNYLLYGHGEDYVTDDAYCTLVASVREEFERGPDLVDASDEYLWEFTLEELLKLSMPDLQS